MIDNALPQDRLRDKLSETRDNLVDAGHLAKEAVVEKLQDLKASAGASYDAGKTKLKDLGNRLVTKVKAAPMQSVLIAAGVGLLLGIVWRRR